MASATWQWQHCGMTQWGPSLEHTHTEWNTGEQLMGRQVHRQAGKKQTRDHEASNLRWGGRNTEVLATQANDRTQKQKQK